MIYASEAREQTVSIVKGKELDKIEMDINSAIKHGKFSITVNRLSEATKQTLEEFGYTIKHYNGDYRTDESWSISWYANN